MSLLLPFARGVGQRLCVPCFPSKRGWTTFPSDSDFDRRGTLRSLSIDSCSSLCKFGSRDVALAQSEAWVTLCWQAAIPTGGSSVVQTHPRGKQGAPVLSLLPFIKAQEFELLIANSVGNRRIMTMLKGPYTCYV